MDEPIVAATDGAGLWQQLVESGSLDVLGLDKDLESLLSDKLQLTELSEAALRQVSVEEFVNAFFLIAQPYVSMWSDLLAFFEAAGAAQGNRQLEAVFDFAEDRTQLTFDLGQFRRLVQVATESVMPFRLDSASPEDLWRAAIRPDSGEGRDLDLDGQGPTFQFIEDIAAGTYPIRMPGRPSTEVAELDRLIGEIWELAGAVLNDLGALFGSRARAVRDVRDSEATPAPSGLPRDTAFVLSSDYWHRAVVLGAEWAVTLPVDRQTHIASNLDGALEPLRNSDPTRTTQIARLIELLSLPLWRHRYDLYSSWVATRVADAFAEKPLQLHSFGGRLAFSFSGTHLGTIDLVPRLHIWSELRTDLQNPVGKGRVDGIQPDLVLRADPLTEVIVPLVVESKQYRRPNYAEFGHAITDYANGHPAATVLLVNYGPGQTDTLLEHVDALVRDRARFVPEMRPDNASALKQFRSFVREAVKLGEPEAAAVKLPISAVEDVEASAGVNRQGRGFIELRWGASPQDLDLHVLVQGYEISYSRPGSLTEAPFALLENDDRLGFGNERVSIDRWLSGEYTVTVVNYSKESSIPAGQARVRVVLGDDEAVFTGPDQDEAEVWHVCTIDGQQKRVVPAASS